MANAWRIDFSDWKMKDKRAFTRATIEAGEKSDESLIYPHLAMVIKAWPYAGDPSNPESYDELTPDQFEEASKQFAAALTARFQRSE